MKSLKESILDQDFDIQYDNKLENKTPLLKKLNSFEEVINAMEEYFKGNLVKPVKIRKGIKVFPDWLHHTTYKYTYKYPVNRYVKFEFINNIISSKGSKAKDYLYIGEYHNYHGDQVLLLPETNMMGSKNTYACVKISLDELKNNNIFEIIGKRSAEASVWGEIYM